MIENESLNLIKVSKNV